MGTEDRLGIDINGVIIPRQNQPRHRMVLQDVYIPPIESALHSIQALVLEKFGPQNVYLISKSSGGRRLKTLRWLSQHHFYEQTGILRGHVYFCETRKDKARICERLQITHFIDDRLEVLSYLTSVSHLYLFQPSPLEVERFIDVLPKVHRFESWKDVVSQMLNKS